jgi:ssDNA-binding Zn-finger/Zn-ribbon topoisomerase 1
MKANHEPKKRARDDIDLVPHPRAREMARRAHGRAARMSAAEIRAKVWQLRDGTILAETAVLANVERQRTSWCARPVYVDLLKRCKTCRRPFLFYANEQRFWYETLRFDVNIDCVNCPPCRKVAHRAKACLHRYAKAMSAPRLDAKAMKTFVDDSLYLLEQGLVRNLARLGAIKNRAQRELGAYAATQRLAQTLARAREAAEMRPGAWRNRHWGA